MNNNSSPDCYACLTQETSIFQNINDKYLALLNHYKRLGHYKKGQTLFHEGQPAFGIYCLKAGYVKLYKTGTDGHQHILRVVEPGELFGHLALFSRNLHSSTAEVLENAMCCFIDEKALMTILSNSKDITWNLVQELTKEVVVANNKVQELAHRTVRERVARLLLSFHEKYGLTTKSGIRLDISLSREDIASLVGTSVESIVRVLSAFQKENLVRKKIRNIYLTDLDGLKEVAGIIE